MRRLGAAEPGLDRGELLLLGALDIAQMAGDPASRHAVCEGRIGSAIESECTTDSAGARGSASPFTREIEVTRHAPLWPPRKVVNMGSMEAWNRAGIKPAFSVLPSAACKTAAPR